LTFPWIENTVRSLYPNFQCYSIKNEDDFDFSVCQVLLQSAVMGRTIKTEHAGAKNGGGYWGERAIAKQRSKKLRRRVGKLSSTAPNASYTS